MAVETVDEVSNDYLEMSDEELMALDPNTVSTAAPEPVAEEVVEEVAEEVAEEAADPVADKEPAPADADDADDVAADKPEVAAKPDEKEPAKDDVDYKAEYAKIFAPFKANGKEIAVTNAEDAIALMQMGANYNKKMAALKPNLKLMKLLENSGLLSEEKIGFLIDLDKKSPEAISKLIKDSGLEPMDLDADKASGYKPNTYTVDDREIELDTVLDELQGSPSYTRTLDIVSTKWDGPSKQVIATSPQLLKVINSHIDSGIYDIISKEVEHEKLFGRLNGLSDIEAYRTVGDAIQLRGGFDHLAKPVQAAPAKAVVVTPKPKVEDDKLRDKKRAASSTKPTSAGQSNQDFNPLALSDDAFGKLVKNEYL